MVVTKNEARALDLGLAAAIPLLQMNAGRKEGRVARKLLKAAESAQKKLEEMLE